MAEEKFHNVQRIGCAKDISGLSKKDLLESLPLTFLQQLAHKAMEGVSALHECSQIVDGHPDPVDDETKTWITLTI